MRRLVLCCVVAFFLGLLVGRQPVPFSRTPDYTRGRLINLMPADIPGGGMSHHDYGGYSAVIRFPDETTITIPVAAVLAETYARGVGGSTR